MQHESILVLWTGVKWWWSRCQWRLGRSRFTGLGRYSGSRTQEERGEGIRLGFWFFTDETQYYCMRARGNRYYVMRLIVGFSARSGTEQRVCGGEMERSVCTVCNTPHSAGVQSRGVFLSLSLRRRRHSPQLEARSRQSLRVCKQLINREPDFQVFRTCKGRRSGVPWGPLQNQVINHTRHSHELSVRAAVVLFYLQNGWFSSCTIRMNINGAILSQSPSKWPFGPALWR